MCSAGVLRMQDGGGGAWGQLQKESSKTDRGLLSYSCDVPFSLLQSARSHAITGESLCRRSIDTTQLIDWLKSSKSFLFGHSPVKADCL